MAKSSSTQSPMYNLPKSGNDKLAGVMWQIVAIGLCAIVVISWLATQYVASKLGHQSALGAPLWVIPGIDYPIYQPVGWVVWGWKYGDMDNPLVKDIFGNAYMAVTGGVLLSVFLAAYLSYRRTKNLSSGNEHIHGSAHWATPEEVKATGLIGNSSGVYVGAYQPPNSTSIKYLRHDGPEHVMAFAPTRSGKGVGLVLPTLLSWPHSALIYDIKGENYALTAGWRGTQADNTILKFEPTATDGSSVRFNPLSEIRLNTDKEVSDVQNIVTMIVDPDGKGLNDHWSKTGHALLVGAVLHVLYAEANKTLAGVAEFLSNPEMPINETLNYMLGTEHDADGVKGWPNNVHPVVAASARDMLNKSENEASGVLSTAMSFLALYRDPIVSKNTAFSEFKVRDLMNADRPVSLYLVVPPSDKDRLKPLVRLMINQVVRTLTEHMEFKDGRSVAGYKHRLLLMIDEFPSLGKLDIFEEALAFIAGYGMKAYLIIQDISQLWTAYGKDESIFSNCHVRVAYAPNKIETADLLSKMTGTATIVKEQASYSGDRLQPMLGNVSTSVQEVSRALLTPDEVMRLRGPVKNSKGDITEGGDMLVFVAGHSPIYGRQILYFLDPVFSERAKVAAPKFSQKLIAELPAPARALDKEETPPPASEQEPADPAIAATYAAAEGIASPAAAALSQVAKQAANIDQDTGEILEYAPDEIADADHTAAPPPMEAPPIEQDDEHMPPPMGEALPAGFDVPEDSMATDGHGLAAPFVANAEPAEMVTDEANQVAQIVTNSEPAEMVTEIDTAQLQSVTNEEAAAMVTETGIEELEIVTTEEPDLLAQMKALSAGEGGEGDDFMGMFDDVLDATEEPKKPTKKPTKPEVQAIDLTDAMADVLTELGQEIRQSKP